MLAKAISKIEDLVMKNTAIPKLAIGDSIYTRDQNGNVRWLCDRDDIEKNPAVINVYSLTGLVEWVKQEVTNYENKGRLYLEIPEYNEVICRTSRNAIRQGEAATLFRLYDEGCNKFYEGARAINKAIIELRSLYQNTSDLDYLLDLLGSISFDDSVKSEDNGITQTVSVKQGVALKASKPVKPIVELRPFRTFMEVEQPSSNFLVRIDNDKTISLYEADGGMWRLSARKIIQEYLINHLHDEIEQKKIVVTL